MEVQGRPVLAPRPLSGRLDAAWARRWAALALATVVTVAALVVDAQPLRSPWWTYADADASYAASALNLMLGRDVRFVDHPGLPITQAVAVAFAGQVVAEEGSFSEASRLAFADRTMLDLDGARGTFRGFAAAFYLAGALLAFVLAARLFGHWTWGLASGLLWIAAPGLVAMSIQLRPDVLLSALCVVFAFAVARALERRTVAWYAGAAALVGFAAMVKVHALALLPALALAALWRPAADTRELGPRARAWARAHAGALGAVGAIWLLLALLMNGVRLPFGINGGQALMLAGLLATVAAAVALGECAERGGATLRRIAGRGTAAIVAGFVAGLLAPVTIAVPEGLRALVYMAKNISGQGVQEGVESFSTPLSNIPSIVGGPAVLVFLVAALAALLGLARRDPLPVVWSLGALTMGVMAFARPPNVHYFAPSFVLASFALLWLLQREPRARTSLLVWPVVLWLVWPAWTGRDAPRVEQERLAAIYAEAKTWTEERLGPGEVALVPSYAPFADARFFELVQIYVEHTPQYPYRFVPATGALRPFAAVRAWRPRYFIGPQVIGSAGEGRAPVGELGEYTLRPTGAGGGLVAELVQGPGVTEPW